MSSDSSNNCFADCPEFQIASLEDARNILGSKVEKSPLPMCFTNEAIRELLLTVGKLPPETGAKGFGPKDLMGFDRIEFDINGSRQANGVVYAPDKDWGSERVHYHLDVPETIMRVWNGDIHTHPGKKFGRPSSKSGEGLGDMGYVEEVFRQNEWMEFFALPILTNTGKGKIPRLWPWICRRGNPPELYFAELVVCKADKFPERIYNPYWEKELESKKDIVTEETVTRDSFPNRDNTTGTGISDEYKESIVEEARVSNEEERHAEPTGIVNENSCDKSGKQEIIQPININISISQPYQPVLPLIDALAIFKSLNAYFPWGLRSMSSFTAISDSNFPSNPETRGRHRQSPSYEPSQVDSSNKGEEPPSKPLPKHESDSNEDACQALAQDRSILPRLKGLWSKSQDALDSLDTFPSLTIFSTLIGIIVALTSILTISFVQPTWLERIAQFYVLWINKNLLAFGGLFWDNTLPAWCLIVLVLITIALLAFRKRIKP
ncbi:MAG: hypothetical protein K8T10_15815 [Candidatus Eremiobacteraeota bacterium]|nr:hypothetical protein [Candidatus Eremiobacteraeota bacterium]